MWAHVTAPQYDGIEGYTIDIMPVVGMLVGTLTCWFMRNYVDNIFGFGVSCLVCVVSALFATLSLLHGHTPVSIATFLVTLISGVIAWNLFKVSNRLRLSI